MNHVILQMLIVTLTLAKNIASLHVWPSQLLCDKIFPYCTIASTYQLLALSITGILPCPNDQIQKSCVVGTTADQIFPRSKQEVQTNSTNNTLCMTTAQMRQMEQNLDKPARVAAQNMSLSLHSFKKLCKELNIRKWPYRKVSNT